jgi:integrase/recombinase XerD
MATLKLRYVNSFRDRHGKLRHQCRIPGRKSFRLPGMPGSIEFMEAYRAALAGALKGSTSEIGADRTSPGSVNAAIVAYYKHVSFTEGLSPASQQMRRPILERFRKAHGGKRLALLTADHVTALLEPMKPHAKKNWLKALRGLMAFAKAQNLIKTDPTAEVVVKVEKGMGHMTWHEPQIEKYRAHHLLGTTARLAFELMLNIAARRHDAHALGHQHIRDEGKGPKLCWRPHKTLRTTKKLLKVRVMPELQAALDAMPPSSDDVLTFLRNDYGRPFASAAAFGNKFADWCKAAGLKPVLCDDGKMRSYRAHGLRKAALRTLAHAGCTEDEMMQVSGHADARQLREYLDEVDQEQMADAAMEKLAQKRGGDQNANTDLQTFPREVTNRKISA